MTKGDVAALVQYLLDEVNAADRQSSAAERTRDPLAQVYFRARTEALGDIAQWLQARWSPDQGGRAAGPALAGRTRM